MIVAVRVRPLNQKEITKNDTDIISVQEKMIVSDQTATDRLMCRL